MKEPESRLVAPNGEDLDPPLPSHPDLGPRGTLVTVAFSASIAWGAALLFLCQPMLTRLILPSFGGSPSVWATSSFLFQFLLLVGYALVHVSTSRLGRRHLVPHLGLVVVSLVALPLALPEDAAPATDAEPVWWLIRTLLLAVGLPFLVLAMTGPILQLWFSWTGHPGAADPYFLYASSNAGSLLGLLSYPFLIEWLLPLSGQTRLWSLGYVGYVVLMLLCGAVVMRARGSLAGAPATATAVALEEAEAPAPVDTRRRLRWLFWAFLPAGVSLAVTTHLTTDVAAFPLLWVLPLALYLVSFILAFGRRSRNVPVWPVLVAVVLAAVSLVLASPGLDAPIEISIAIGLALVFMAGLAGHVRLASDRPSVGHLTGFYLIISTGGLLGGLLNGVVAPLALNGPWEYHLQLALTPLLAVGLRLPRPRARVLARFGTAGWVAEVVVVTGLAGVLVALAVDGSWLVLAVALVGGLIAIAGLLDAINPRMVALVICGLMIAIAAGPVVRDASAWRGRTFFGSYRVDISESRHTFVHGTTLHGWQGWSDGPPSLVPTSYYTREGPLGDVMALGSSEPRSLGFIGLGIGTALSYVGTEDRADVVEIDPLVVDVAGNTEWFTFLDSAADRARVRVGDGRLVLRDELPDAAFDVLVVDAFSSDSIPVHLLTREAMELYLSRVQAGGLVAVHVSNRHLDLEPIVAALADALGASAAVRSDSGQTDEAIPSTWIVLSRQERGVDRLVDSGWSRLTGGAGPLWTDEYSSVLQALR